MKSQNTLHIKDGNRDKPNSMRIWYFLLIFLISIIFLGRILWPFWSILVLSFLLTNIFRPIYKLLSKKMPNGLASILTCLLIIFIVFLAAHLISFFILSPLIPIDFGKLVGLTS